MHVYVSVHVCKREQARVLTRARYTNLQERENGPSILHLNRILEITLNVEPHLSFHGHYEVVTSHVVMALPEEIVEVVF